MAKRRKSSMFGGVQLKKHNRKMRKVNALYRGKGMNNRLTREKGSKA